MQILIHENGYYVVNTYIIVNEKINECVILDPGEETDPVIRKINNAGLKPMAIVCTHGHIDHMEGVLTLKRRYDIPFYMNEHDWHFVQNVQVEESIEQGIPAQGVPFPDKNLPLEGSITLAGIEFQLIHSPGHTNGSVSLYAYHSLFTGDTLLSLSIGRTNFSGASEAQLINTIQEKFFVLPENTIVYPGHGPVTTIKQEKRLNPYIIQANPR
jgi:glyoxylase-like metal-dependent hydrolase (beta-lactamase superfamily II)